MYVIYYEAEKQRPTRWSPDGVAQEVAWRYWYLRTDRFKPPTPEPGTKRLTVLSLAVFIKKRR